MPQNQSVDIPANTWTLLTSNDVTAITFQVSQKKNVPVFLVGTVGAVPPTNKDNSIQYFRLEGEFSINLADMFPGVSGVNRLYAWCEDSTSIFVSHA